MYLAKFFHRPPGDDDRELLFIPDDDPMIIGIHMNRTSQPESDEFLRKEFSDIGVPAQESRSVVIHLEKGDRFGWCFHWDHDGVWELERSSPNFDAALKARSPMASRSATRPC